MKCTLMPGIKSISGSMKQKNGSRIVFKTFSKPSVNRGSKTETRVYLMPRQERKTPLSENEIAARKRFLEATTYFKNLSNEQKQRYCKEFSRNKYTFNGKKYSTLRGYVIARFYAGETIPSDQTAAKLLKVEREIENAAERLSIQPNAYRLLHSREQAPEVQNPLIISHDFNKSFASLTKISLRDQKIKKMAMRIVVRV